MTTLNADPTVQYAIGNTRDASTWWPEHYAGRLYGCSSPYNTYQNPGLPPGPIAIPASPWIRAVIYAPSTPYYYFRADCTNSGHHRFAQAPEEQQANACP